MATLGFLHTAGVHVETFDALVGSASGSVATVHAVVPELLAEARATGPTPALADAVAGQLVTLADAGAEVVVCTCSSLGPIAEDVATRLSIPVMRVDRPMARAAVATAARIAVVAALESTLVPTGELLADEAARAGSSPEVVEVCIPAAWAAFEAGDSAAYLDQIAAAARSAAAASDVVVLAQASMAGALDLLGDLTVPVLVSPPLAVAAALRLVEHGRASR
jgi:Asp/Glu/hydantoin racemase